MTKKEREILKLASKKGANDAALFLLNQLHITEESLNEKIDLTENRIEVLEDKFVKAPTVAFTDETKIEKIATRLATKMATIEKGDRGDKGDKGDNPTKGELISLIIPLIPKVKDGHTPTDEELVDIIKPLIPKVEIPEIKLPEPETSDKIRNKLESLKGDDRLNKDAIKGLKEEIEMLKQSIVSIRASKRMGMRKVPIIKRENLTSQVNGVTTTFTLPRDTVAVVGVFSTQFPITFDSADFSLSGNTLTLNTGIVQYGQTLFAIIETLFYG